jgi:hypothetical protein
MLLRAAAGLGMGFALLAWGLPAAPATDAKAEEGSCSAHGTSVSFFDSPSAAAQRAKKEQKLVMVLHVSGNFETPDFT